MFCLGYRAIAPDQRGYGRTDSPPHVRDYRIAELMDDLEGLLDSLDLKSATFVGHDWGALLLWHMSLVRPELIDRQIPDQWRWHGKRVHLIDGTTLSMPDTAENQAVYPQQRTQKLGIGFPICRLVGVICLSSGALLNAAVGRFQGKGADE